MIHAEPNDSPRRRATFRLLVCAGVVALSAAGCASPKMVSLRAVPHSPLIDDLKRTATGGPAPSDRTQQLLRVYDLTEDIKGDPQRFLKKVQSVVDREPTSENVYAIAELSYLQAKRVEANDKALALNLHGAAVLHAYRYLFDGRFRELRNPYDPHFRRACDVYNGALESALRLICKSEGLRPGKTYSLQTAAGKRDVVCTLRGDRWRYEDFARFEFVSDYEIRGLKNHYQTYGLGVPLIAVRRTYPGEPAAARYYPRDLSFPMTAVLRPMFEHSDRSDQPGDATTRHAAALELYDPFEQSDVELAGLRVPLESDLTTPLAFFLSNPCFGDLATNGLLRPDRLLAKGDSGAPALGLYMVGPYEPNKIPVVLIHGLWSSPLTWTEMFNDLRSVPEVREHYQIWFYFYPTAQPFWITASQLRQDLATIRNVVDPQRRKPALDQTVLVGHSMGGLVARLQTLAGGDAYWRLASRQPLEDVKAPPDIKQRLNDCFYFEPNPSIRRVVTIGTPHHGSTLSNQTTQWIAGKLIHLPRVLMQNQEALFRDNSDKFKSESLLYIDTSIDSLSPRTPIFTTMNAGSRAPWVKYHNIVGVVPKTGFLGYMAGNGDGVVSYDSAHLTDSVSELIVPADHTSVHAHPLAVLEVRRILLEHLAELRAIPDSRCVLRTAQQAAAANAPTRR